MSPPEVIREYVTQPDPFSPSGMDQARLEVFDLMTGPFLRAVGSLSPDTLIDGRSDHPKQLEKKRLKVPSLYFPDGKDRILPKEKALIVGHRHENLELYLPVSGSPLFTLGGVLYRLSDSDLVVIPPDVPHFGCCSSANRPYVMLSLSLSSSVGRAFINEYSPRAGYTLRCYATLGTMGSAPEAIADLVRARDWMPKNLRSLRKGLLSIAHRSADFLSSLDMSAKEEAPEIVRYAQHFIRVHYREKLSLSDVAEGVHISPNHLSTLFKRATGRTVLEVIQELKLADAKRRLLDSGASVKAIAYELGFETPHYFSRFFRKMTGRTPSEFRSASTAKE